MDKDIMELELTKGVWENIIKKSGMDLALASLEKFSGEDKLQNINLFLREVVDISYIFLPATRPPEGPYRSKLIAKCIESNLEKKASRYVKRLNKKVRRSYNELSDILIRKYNSTPIKIKRRQSKPTKTRNNVSQHNQNSKQTNKKLAKKCHCLKKKSVSYRHRV